MGPAAGILFLLRSQWFVLFPFSPEILLNSPKPQVPDGVVVDAIRLLKGRSRSLGNPDPGQGKSTREAFI